MCIGPVVSGNSCNASSNPKDRTRCATIAYISPVVRIGVIPKSSELPVTGSITAAPGGNPLDTKMTLVPEIDF